jgi:hypothetical protein
MSDYRSVFDEMKKKYGSKYCEKPRINYLNENELRLYESILDECEKKQWEYRSIHYTLRIENGMKRVKAEVQARTVFEEGWSEINEHIYKAQTSNSEDAITASRVLFSLVGSCNDMGMMLKSLEGKTSTKNLTDGHVPRISMNERLESSQGDAIHKENCGLFDDLMEALHGGLKRDTIA